MRRQNGSTEQYRGSQPHEYKASPGPIFGYIKMWHMQALDTSPPVRAGELVTALPETSGPVAGA